MALPFLRIIPLLYLLFREHHLFAVEHPSQTPDSDARVDHIGHQCNNDGHPSHLVGKDSRHHLDGVVEGYHVSRQALRRATLEHRHQATEHHHQHEWRNHRARVLDIFG